MRRCNCSAKNFAKLTNISEATISRYRRGVTIPRLSSDNIERISIVLADLLKEDNKAIYNDLFLSAYEDLDAVDYDIFASKLDKILKLLGISKTKVAKAIHFSYAYIYRICTSNIKPRDPYYIADNIAKYIASNYCDYISQEKVKGLILEGSDISLLNFKTNSDYAVEIKGWLIN